MIDTLVAKYVKALVNLKIISVKEYEQLKYQLLCIVESAIVIVAMLIVGAVFKCLVNWCIFIVCFFVIRNRTGGFHLNSFGKCFFGTLTLQIIGILIIEYMTQNLVKVFDITMIISFLVIILVGTLNHPNMNYSVEELIVSKRISRVMAVFVVSIIFLLRCVSVSEKTVMFMEYAVILSGVLLLLGIFVGQNKKVL